MKHRNMFQKQTNNFVANTINISFAVFFLFMFIAFETIKCKNDFVEVFTKFAGLSIVYLTSLVIYSFCLRVKFSTIEILNSEGNNNYEIIKRNIFSFFSFFHNPGFYKMIILLMTFTIVFLLTFFAMNVEFNCLCIKNADKLSILNFITPFLCLVFCLLFYNYSNVNECRFTVSQNIFNEKGLDPGSFMACSYFYGYLKIVLPSSGGKERRGIANLMEKYEDNEKCTIPVKKLFILIPSSSYITKDLKDMSDWFESAKKLETIAIDRAGVIKRTYFSTMYKITPNGDPKNDTIYLATEGATPVLTNLEVQTSSHRYASLYKEFNAEIIKNFYLTLQQLLDDNKDCKDYCELVYYQDEINGKKVNVAEILLNRIKEIQSNN